MVKTNKVTTKGYLIQNATADGISALVNLNQFNTLNFNIVTTGLTAGTILLIQSSHDNVNWLTVDTLSLIHI